MTFRERYNKWKAGEQVYSAGRVLQGYEDGKDKRPSYYRRAEDLIAKGEGFRSGVYQNEGDVPTAGYGFTAKQDLHNWNEADARKRLREIMVQNEDSIRKSGISDWYFNRATEGQKAAILDMMYQGGAYRLNKMPNFVKAIQSGDMNAAAKEFNFAASQTPNRHKARYDAFMEGVTTPANVVKQKIAQQQTAPVDNTRVQLVMPNIDQVVYPNQEYISKYAGDPVRPSFEQTMQDRRNIWNLLNTPQYIINPPQFVPQFELNTQLEQPWTVR